MNLEQFQQWRLNDVKTPLVMGILNITPDSFYDGGKYLNVNAAYDYAMRMVADGAHIIDLGGESSRHGADYVSVDEELSRVIPVIEKIRQVSDVCISIDTYKAMVMQEAVLAGASLINDIMALQHENALVTAAQLNVPICLMHMHGMPKTMQQEPMQNENVIAAINAFFSQRIAACLDAGIHSDRLILDPGFGFGKTLQQNMCLVKQIASFKTHQLPLLLGVSRKSSLKTILAAYPEELSVAGTTVAVYAMMHGVSIIRTHDVSSICAALLILENLGKSYDCA